MQNINALKNLKIPVDVKNDINAVTKSFIDRFPENIHKIILFGSYSDLSYQTDSDIDIAVVLNKLPPLKERRVYYEQTVDTDREVDLLFCTEEQINKGEYVYKHINSGGILLYEQL